MSENEVVLAYAAGFVEADGCFCISTSTSIRVANRNPEVLNWFLENFGGSVKAKIVPAGCYEWSLHGLPAIVLAKKLYPFCKFKKPQVEILAKFYETIGARGRRTTEETKTKRRLIKQELFMEKAKWRTSKQNM